MNLSRRTALTVAAWAGAGVLGAAVVTGVASAASPGAPAPIPPSGPAAGSTTPQQQAPPAKGHRGEGLGRMLHGQYVVQTKDGVRTMDVQRGDIKAVNATSITLKSTDGFVGTYAVTADTKVRKDGATVAIGTLKTGDKAGVVAVEVGTSKTARAVTERTPGVRPAHRGKGERKAPAGASTTQSGSYGESATDAGELAG